MCPYETISLAGSGHSLQVMPKRAKHLQALVRASVGRSTQAQLLRHLLPKLSAAVPYAENRSKRIVISKAFFTIISNRNVTLPMQILK